MTGEEIPLSARIVAVADVWDALTSDRSYRPAWPYERALEVMHEGRGSQFDERCLDAFFEVMARHEPVRTFPEPQKSPAPRPGASPAA